MAAAAADGRHQKGRKMPGVVCWPWSFALFIFRPGFCLSQLGRKKKKRKRAHQRHLNAISLLNVAMAFARRVYNSIVYFFLEKEIYVAFDYVDYSIYAYNTTAAQQYIFFSPAFDLFLQRFCFVIHYIALFLLTSL